MLSEKKILAMYRDAVERYGATETRFGSITASSYAGELYLLAEILGFSEKKVEKDIAKVKSDAIAYINRMM